LLHVLFLHFCLQDHTRCIRKFDDSS
jgi:hypothetical protein